MTKARDRKNGRFAHTADAICACGHALDVHTAAVVGGERPCLVGGFGDATCDCARFRKARTVTKAGPLAQKD